jgi:hypothetical protein
MCVFCCLFQVLSEYTMYFLTAKAPVKVTCTIFYWRTLNCQAMKDAPTYHVHCYQSGKIIISCCLYAQYTLSNELTQVTCNAASRLIIPILLQFTINMKVIGPIIIFLLILALDQACKSDRCVLLIYSCSKTNNKHPSSLASSCYDLKTQIYTVCAFFVHSSWNHFQLRQSSFSSIFIVNLHHHLLYPSPFYSFWVWVLFYFGALLSSGNSPFQVSIWICF